MSCAGINKASQILDDEQQHPFVDHLPGSE